MKKIFISCGEASGEKYANELIQQILHLRDDIHIQTTGNKYIKENPRCNIIEDYSRISFIGFWDIIKHIGVVLSYLKGLKKKINTFEPDLIILIDFPGLNLRLMKWAKAKRYKVIYFIPPKVWAWNEKRGKTLSENSDTIISVLPFEQKYYSTKWEKKVDYYGHPISEIIQEELQSPPKINLQTKKKIVALLPGSRTSEIKHMAKRMAKVSKKFKNVQFALCQSKTTDDEKFKFIRKSKQYKNIIIVKDRTYDILRQSKAAIVKSGTSTLEVALLKVPQIVCYRTNLINYMLIKLFLKVKFCSLPNLILEKPLVKELLQYRMTTKNIRKQLNMILNQPHVASDIKKGYNNIAKKVRYNEIGSYSYSHSIMESIAKGILKEL